MLHKVANDVFFFSLFQTYVGDILIAVNPFRDLGIYGHDVSYFNRCIFILSENDYLMLSVVHVAICAL